MNRILTGVALEQSIIDVIDRYCLGVQAVTGPVTAGSMSLELEGTERIQSGQQIELFDATHAETHVVDCVTSWTTVELSSPIVSDFETAQIQHLYDGLPIARCYMGNPPVKAQYPIITVTLVSESEPEYLTFEDVRHLCEFVITIECETASYDESYKTIRTIARRVQNAITRPFTYLVEPYLKTTLSAPVTAGQDFFTVDDPSMIGGYALFQLPYAQYSIPVFSRDDSEYGSIFHTDHVFTRSFSAGQTVITPLVHVFRTSLEDVRYDREHADGGLMQSCSIDFSYSIQLNQRRKYDTI